MTNKLYIFGIGGTGARVLRSLTMMMAAGVNIGVNQIEPIIIDPDFANADLTRTVSLMNLYKTIRSNLTFSNNDPTQFFRTDIIQSLVNYTLKIEDTDDKTFQEFIGLASMDRTSQAITRMLFSDSNLKSTMDVGFKGNPNIGSVVLNQIVQSDDFQRFANGFSQGDKIFIISSIFGGTGASGFPLLLKTLRTGSDFPNNDLINKAEIGAISILPYFKLERKDESAIDSSTFISKTKSALAYYENNIIKNASINALYFLGDDITNTYANNEGGSAQQNDAHLIEFLSATAIVDFCNKQHPYTVNKELGIKETNSNVDFRLLYPELRSLLFTPLTQFTMMANCINYKFEYFSSNDFNANYNNFNGLYNSYFMINLKEFTNLFVSWIKEMNNNKRSLNIFNINVLDEPFNIVVGYTPKKIVSLKSNYYLIASRLNAAVKKCNSKNNQNKFLEMFYNGTQRLIEEKIK